MVRYTPAMAVANLLVLAQALPAQPAVCSQIVRVITGPGRWVPEPDPTWSAWSDPASSTKTKTPEAKTTSSVVWSDWSDPSASTKTSTSDAETWTVWTTSSSSTSAKATSTTTKKGGEFFPSSSTTTSAHVFPTTTSSYTTTEAPRTTTTTSAYTTSSSSTTTASTTTSAAPKSTATCPAYNEQFSKQTGASGSGSCGSTYTVNCGARVNVPQDGSVKFWERASGELINSLAECVAICDENSSCTAVIYTNYSGASAQDFKHCYQTSGLPQPSIFGGAGQYGQIAYKGASSGTCASTYTN